MHTDHPHADRALGIALQEELGKRQLVVDEGDPTAPIAYFHPGAEHALVIFSHQTSIGTILRIDAPVAGRADLNTPGFSEAMLREQANWLFGRVEHRGEGLVIEHCILADTPPEQIASMVIGLADTALHLNHDLARMGALTLFDEAA